MRSSPAFILRVGAFLCALAACAESRAPVVRSMVPAARPARSPDLHPALALAELLPSDAERCVVAAPALVPLSERPLVGLLSQADELPWALAIDVSGFARAELRDGASARRSVTYVRFAGSSRQRIRAELDQLGKQPFDWDEASHCEGELTCTPVRARFVDDHTVLITSGKALHAPPSGAVPGPCVELLRREPHAVEVSAQRSELALAVGPGRAS